MLIDIENAYQGNQAMAWVLLLYYHLVREGGITHDQTVYVNSEQFDAFQYIAVNVSAEQQHEISQRLIRQGAVIYLLCELNDMVSDYESDHLQQPFTQRVLSTLASEPAVTAIPEVAKILQMVSAVQPPLDFSAFQAELRKVFTTYVVQEFKALVALSGA
jgi:hypothetical protein